MCKQKVDPSYGTEEDFKDLVSAVHERGLKLILDHPIVETSTSHPWFTKSSLRQDPFQDYYRWLDLSKDQEAPENYTVTTFSNTSLTLDVNVC